MHLHTQCSMHIEVLCGLQPHQQQFKLATVLNKGHLRLVCRVPAIAGSEIQVLGTWLAIAILQQAAIMLVQFPKFPADFPVGK